MRPGISAVDPDADRISELSEAALSRLVRQFYATARLDPALGPVFAGAVSDWEPHIERVTAFWSRAMLGSPGYSGNPLAAHLKHALTPEMFDCWLTLWGAAVDAVFAAEAAEALKSRAALIAESLKLGLFFRPAEGG